MAKKRAKISPTNLFDKTEQQDDSTTSKQARSAKPQTEGGNVRAVYDFSSHVKNAVADRATRLGIPASQLAAFLLNDALQRLDTGAIDPTPFLVESESPRFRNNLEFDDWYQG